jgi:hypothetical protein
MMKWGWDFNRREEVTLARRDSWDRDVVLEHNIPSMDEFRMSVANAVNGKVVQISKPIINAKGQNTGDREAEMYVVAEGQSLSDVVNAILNLEDVK